ncbi:UNVERIFIED_ORG: OmpA family protein [Martelella mediterranea]
MTDMTVSFLFIVLILLAFFATQVAPQEKDQVVPRTIHDAALDQLAERQREIVLLKNEVERLRRLVPQSTDTNPIETYNTNVAASRGKLLREIKSKIESQDLNIEVTVSRDMDALQFKGNGLFAVSSSEPSSVGREQIIEVAKILIDELRCYTLGLGSAVEGSCNPDLALIDSLQIEGHTDSQGTDIFNMDLSTKRGDQVFEILVQAQPDLLAFDNLHAQPILSVAGYGKGRPIADNETAEGRDNNRRIDLRFIMFSPVSEEMIPHDVADIGRIQDIFDRGRASQ